MILSDALYFTLPISHKASCQFLLHAVLTPGQEVLCHLKIIRQKVLSAFTFAKNLRNQTLEVTLEKTRKKGRIYVTEIEGMAGYCSMLCKNALIS